MNRIKSFKNKSTETIYNGDFAKDLPADIQSVALRKLIMIDNASTLNDLRVPPGNKLEALNGDRTGQFSIRINDKYRICFKCVDAGFEELEIVDYHK